MNEILINILGAFVTFVVIPLITWGGTELVKHLSTKTKLDKTQEYIKEATDAVVLAVSEVSQTYVDSLKSKGVFDKKAHIKAFQDAKAKAISIISEEAKKAIGTVYNDFDFWLELIIEAKVKELK